MMLQFIILLITLSEHGYFLPTSYYIKGHQAKSRSNLSDRFYKNINTSLIILSIFISFNWSDCAQSQSNFVFLIKKNNLTLYHQTMRRRWIFYNTKYINEEDDSESRATSKTALQKLKMIASEDSLKFITTKKCVI